MSTTSRQGEGQPSIEKPLERGPYLTNPPAEFVVDANGYAWVIWPDDGSPVGGMMSMVVSTPANESPEPWVHYVRDDSVDQRLVDALVEIDLLRRERDALASGLQRSVENWNSEVAAFLAEMDKRRQVVHALAASFSPAPAARPVVDGRPR